MCECCSAKTKTFGEPIPGWHLMQATCDGRFMKKGEWGLQTWNDPSYHWSGAAKPVRDPSFGMDDDEEDQLYAGLHSEFRQAFDQFINTVDAIEDRLESEPGTGYNLIRACESAGYSSRVHGSRVACFLVHRMACVLEENPDGDWDHDEYHLSEGENSFGAGV